LLTCILGGFTESHQGHRPTAFLAGGGIWLLISIIAPCGFELKRWRSPRPAGWDDRTNQQLRLLLEL
jgi:hypothetical protein